MAATLSVAALVVLSSLVPPALATDWYVDALSGSNAHGGTSSLDAWRTITHAVASVPATGVQSVHVAPGTYDPALGERFPISMRPGLQLIGDVAGARPMLTSYGTAVVLIEITSSASNPQTIDASMKVEGLRLREALNGVKLEAYAGDVSPTLVDRHIERMSGGKCVNIWLPGPATCSARLERIRCAGGGPVGQGDGLSVISSALPGAQVSASDCEFSDQHHVGVVFVGPGSLRLDRRRIELNDYQGIGLFPLVDLQARSDCFDCSITDNMLDGCVISAQAPPPATPVLTASFARCTIADNASNSGAGIYAQLTGSSISSRSLDHSIVFGHTDDVDFSGAVNAVRSLVGDGSFDGVNGCFSADPLFVDATDGDFRLKCASPCIDAAASAPPAGTLDLLGHARDLDGDLDAVRGSDLGGFEFRPLELVSTGTLGTPLTLELWGPQGNASAVFWTRAGLVAPLATPFGSFELDPALARTFRLVTVGASSPTQIVRNIPSHPALVGQTYAFQALTDSLAAPLSKAFTKGVQVTFAP